jgi:hypothetical protein
MPQPHVVILAGPNAAGKSTLAPRLRRGTLGVAEFVNAVRKSMPPRSGAGTIGASLLGVGPQGRGHDALPFDLRAFVEDERWMARYYLERIEVADPASPSILPEVNIPGMFVDAAAAGNVIDTLESWWDEGEQRMRNLFHALELEADRAFLASSAELPGYVNATLVKDGAAFATTQEWIEVPVGGDGVVGAVGGDGVIGPVGGWSSRTSLLAIDLADAHAVGIAGSAEVPLDYGYLQKVEAGRAFLGSWPGILTYDVRDIAEPLFEEFFRTQGWVQDIVVRGDRAFLPSGYYGVQVLDLASPEER